MSEPIKVSVVTISLNSVGHIEKAIKSVISQTYPNIEYIVIDGGSKDGTVDIVRRYMNHVAHFVSEPDKGLYDAMNKGIKAATGGCIFFLNSDDFFADDKVVEDAARVFNAEPEVDIVFGNQIFDADGKPVPKMKVQKFGDIRERLARTNIQHQTIFTRRRVFDLTGGFSLKYRIVSDYEWLIKAFLVHKCKYRHIDRPISVMTTEGISWTKDFEPERRMVMREFFSLYEIYRFRVLPLMYARFKYKVLCKVVAIKPEKERRVRGDRDSYKKRGGGA